MDGVLNARDVGAFLFVILFMVATFFLKQFASSVRELAKTVNTHGERIAALEALTGRREL